MLAEETVWKSITVVLDELSLTEVAKCKAMPKKLYGIVSTKLEDWKVIVLKST